MDAYLVGLMSLFGIATAFMLGWAIGHKKGMQRQQRIMDIALSKYWDTKTREQTQETIKQEIERVLEQHDWRNRGLS
jgi:hypothetical protein